MLTSRENQVLGLIREDPMMSQQAIAARLGISRSAVAGHIMNLTTKGHIKGRGYVLGDESFAAVIGGANLDIHGKPQNTLRSRDSNPGIVHTSPGGVARNIAENLSRLGIACRLVSAVGDDEHGRILLQSGQDAGVDMRYVEQFPSSTTSTYLSVLDDDGDMQLAVSDMSVMERLDVDHLRQYRSMLERSSLIIVDTNLAAQTLDWIGTTFSGQTIFADTVSTTKASRLESCLAHIHTLKTSADEAQALTGMEARTQRQLRRLARELHASGVTRVFISRGRRGVFYSTGEASGNYKLQTDRPTVRNAGGAGDAFLAGLAYAWLDEWPLEESLQVALAAAEVTVSDPATSSPALSIDAVNNVLETHRERIASQ